MWAKAYEYIASAIYLISFDEKVIVPLIVIGISIPIDFDVADMS